MRRGNIVRYGMAGVQSVPRVMRGAPVVRGRIVDVPLSQRDLAGLDSQGFAHTLSGTCFGDDTIEMPQECVRPGEILIADGVCGPDPRIKASAAEVSPTTYGVPVSTTKLPTASARNAVQNMSKTTMLLAAVAGIGLVYYLSKKR